MKFSIWRICEIPHLKKIIYTFYRGAGTTCTMLPLTLSLGICTSFNLFCQKYSDGVKLISPFLCRSYSLIYMIFSLDRCNDRKFFRSFRKNFTFAKYLQNYFTKFIYFLNFVILLCEQIQNLGVCTFSLIFPRFLNLTHQGSKAYVYVRCIIYRHD